MGQICSLQFCETAELFQRLRHERRLSVRVYVLCSVCSIVCMYICIVNSEDRQEIAETLDNGLGRHVLSPVGKRKSRICVDDPQ